MRCSRFFVYTNYCRQTVHCSDCYITIDFTAYHLMADKNHAKINDFFCSPLLIFIFFHLIITFISLSLLFIPIYISVIYSNLYMKKVNQFLFVCCTISMMSCNNKNIVYPVTEKCNQQDNYFGTVVNDPYRWLEDDMSEKTANWVKAQNEVTFNYLDQIPFRDEMKKSLTEKWNYPKFSSPFKINGRWFMYKNTGLQNQSVLYLLDDWNDEEGTLLLDPNSLSTDGTVALSDIEVSKDGKTLIFSISRGGSDWNEFLFMDIDSKKMLDDHLKWIKFSGIEAFEDGIIYNRYPEPKQGDELKGANENCMVCFHKIGTPQSEDVVLYNDPENPNRTFSLSVSDDEKYMFLYGSESTSGNSLAFKKSNKSKKTKFTSVIDNFNNDTYIIEVIDNKFYALTNVGAPLYRVVLIDPKNPKPENWTEIIPQGDCVIQGVSSIGNRFVVSFLKDAHSVVKVYDYDGKFMYDLDNELIGSLSGFGGKKDDDFTFYSFTSFSVPSVIYRYDIANNKSEEFKRSELKFDSDSYKTEQVFFESVDGTKVPMFITYHKDTKLDGKNPTLLYGYGGFNISLTPSFSMSRIPLLENGGILAVVNLRGGGEYGEKWHKAGTLMQKQNVFDDCISAAEYLIKNNYTSSDYLALQGGSNGGLLVGAVINQRPDLFAVALPAVGVMDMLRYHKFTIGRHWATDYGTSEDSKEMFEYLYGYSPVHTIKENVEYPAVLVTTADHDDRVVPAHSFKYIATLQEKYKGNNPVLIRIESQAGHGAGKPTDKTISEAIDQWAFMFYNMGVSL